MVVPPAAGPAVDTRTLITDAARCRLLAGGYAGLSPRKGAEEAGVPVSQLHYHFGSKGGLILALFEEENRRRLDRQRSLYAEDLPRWQRYERGCDVPEDDLDAGYVRVLQEMAAAGWSNEEVGNAVRELLGGWCALLAAVARDAERRHGPIGPFTAAEPGTLVASPLFRSAGAWPIRSALRRVGVLIRQLEDGRTRGAGMPAAL